MDRLQRICLYIFCFSLNFEVWDPLQTDGYFSISKLTGALYFLSILPAILNFKTASQFKPILRLIGIFFVYLILINAFNANANYDTIIDLTMLQSILLFWVLLNHAQKEPLLMERGLLYFALGSAVFSLLYYYGVGIEVVDQRVSIFGDNENAIGQRMSFSIIIIAMAVLQNRLRLSRSRFLLLLLIPLMLGLLLASGSRLAIVSLVAVFIASVVLIKVRSVFSKIVVLSLGVLSFIIIWQLLMHSDLVGQRLQMSFQEGDLSNRDVIWKGILPVIEQNPIFGIGQTGYASYCNAVFGRYWSPHNVILEVLCFSGMVGLSIYLYFLYQTFRLGYIRYQQDGTLLPLMFAINLIGMLLVSHLLELKLGWAILAYIASSYLPVKEQDTNWVEVNNGLGDEVDDTLYKWIEIGGD